jgi:DNA (cytosine-5)-methyltransferase 1
VVSAIETLGPRWVVIENVIEFSQWILYPTWLQAIGALGYEVEVFHFDAADFGCPADRLRTFVVATPIGSGGAKLPKPPARKACALDAVRLDKGRWRRPRDCAESVQLRAGYQRDRWGHEGAWFTQSVTDHPGRSLSSTAATVTTQHQHGLFKVEGRELLYRPWTLDEYARALGWPEDYDWGRTGVCRGSNFLGNAVAPAVARWIAEHLVSA